MEVRPIGAENAPTFTGIGEVIRPIDALIRQISTEALSPFSENALKEIRRIVSTTPPEKVAEKVYDIVEEWQGDLYVLSPRDKVRLYYETMALGAESVKDIKDFLSSHILGFPTLCSDILKSSNGKERMALLTLCVRANPKFARELYSSEIFRIVFEELDLPEIISLFHSLDQQGMSYVKLLGSAEDHLYSLVDILKEKLKDCKDVEKRITYCHDVMEIQSLPFSLLGTELGDVNILEDIQRCQDPTQKMKLCEAFFNISSFAGSILGQKIDLIGLQSFSRQERIYFVKALVQLGEEIAYGISFKIKELGLDDEESLLSLIHFYCEQGYYHLATNLLGTSKYLWSETIAATPLSMIQKSQDSIAAAILTTPEEHISPQEVERFKAYLSTFPILLPLFDRITQLSFKTEKSAEEQHHIKMGLVRWLSYATFLLIELTPPQQQILDKISNSLNTLFEHQNPTQRYFLLRQLVQIVKSYRQEFDSYFGMTKSWSKESAILLTRLRTQRGLSEETVTGILQKLDSLPNFKDRKHQETLIQFLSELLMHEEFSSDEIELIGKGLLTTLNTEGSRREAMAAISSELQGETNLLRTFGSQPYLEYMRSDDRIGTFFNRRFNTLFEIGEIDDFQNRYQQTFGSFRHHGMTLYTYRRAVGMLPRGERGEVLKTFDAFVKAVLQGRGNGQFHSIRYDENLNPHLKKIFTARPDLKAKWISSKEKFVRIEGTQQPAVQDYKEFFIQKIITNGHLNPNLYPRLTNYLQGKPLVPSQQDTPTEKFEDLAISLCEKKMTPEKFLEEQRKLKIDFGPDFEHDLGTLHAQVAKGNYIITETDDANHLIELCNEIQGSCLRPNGTPQRNKCFLANVMNGEIRPVVIMKEGKLVSRAFLKLWWDDVHQKPLLLLERFYSNEQNEVLSDAVVEYALDKAQEMGLDLVSIEMGKQRSEPFDGSVEYFGGFAPYLYTDAGGGVRNGREHFVVEGCHRIVRS